MSMNKPLKKY